MQSAAECHRICELGHLGEVFIVARPRRKDEPESRGIRIEIATHLAETLPIWGTESGLHLILINLLFNALDALPEGGTIRIASKLDANHGEVTFTDDGVGMDEETVARAIELHDTRAR